MVLQQGLYQSFPCFLVSRIKCESLAKISFNLEIFLLWHQRKIDRLKTWRIFFYKENVQQEMEKCYDLFLGHLSREEQFVFVNVYWEYWYWYYHWPTPPPDLVKGNVLPTELCLSYIYLIGSDSGLWSLLLHFPPISRDLQIRWRISFLLEI